jgi:hypothetical protein
VFKFQSYTKVNYTFEIENGVQNFSKLADTEINLLCIHGVRLYPSSCSRLNSIIMNKTFLPLQDGRSPPRQSMRAISFGNTNRIRDEVVRKLAACNQAQAQQDAPPQASVADPTPEVAAPVESPAALAQQPDKSRDRNQ